ncbi:MAG TPA: methyltransferase domain-containing protein [Syntrophorhabdaceae bacterium]|jgi:SAM-dependent methyltransferase
METRIARVRQSRAKKVTEHVVRGRNRNLREARISEFTEYADGSGYAEGLLKILKIEPEWTVLDVACAGGTLAIPLASRVKSVTAMDHSREMLDLLEERCAERSIKNISPVRGWWDDNWSALKIGVHDVAIASRSLGSHDLLDSVMKLNRVARKQVYISQCVGDGPFDRRIYEATGRKLEMGPSYTHIYYNLLYQHMGILANIAFVREDYANDWASHEEAVEAQKWMFQDLTEAEEDKLRAFMKEHLLRVDGRWRLPYEMQCNWAIMWWEKE